MKSLNIFYTLLIITFCFTLLKFQQVEAKNFSPDYNIRENSTFEKNESSLLENFEFVQSRGFFEFKCLLPWGIFPDLFNCEYFFVCLNYMRFRFQCYMDKGFQITNFQCAPKKEVIFCQIPNPFAFKCPTSGDGLYPDNFDCQFYYWCFNNISYGFQCPDQMLWDTKSKMCVQKDQAICQNSVIPTLPPVPIPIG